MTKTIGLTRGFFTLVDDKHYDVLSKYKWRADNDGYAVTWMRDENNKRRLIRMHRFIMGITDPAVQVDHKDNDKRNNQEDNLRPANASEQGCNRRKVKSNRFSSQYKGVSLVPDAGSWRATIYINRKKISLGYYSTQEEAALVYNAAALKYHGDFANLNIIQQPVVSGGSNSIVNLPAELLAPPAKK
jgi:hypothetical protein